jgi:hypothetical protein
MRSRSRFPPGASFAVPIALALLFVATELGACASVAEAPPQPTDLTALAERLVEAARQRVELNRVRVVVQDIRPLQAALAQRPTANPSERADLVGVALEHAFVNALAVRLNVVESERVSPAVARAPASTLSDLASTYGATHLLVGDYQRRRGEVLVSVRLIEAESHLIIAAVSGRVPLPELVDERDSQRLAVVVPERASTHEVIDTSEATVARETEIALAPATAPPEAASSMPTARTGSAHTDSAHTDPWALPPAASVPARSSATSGVEDFETWRANRVAQAGAAQASTPPPAPKPHTAPAALAPAPAPTPAAAQENFPWRSTAWLAQLLGIPQEPPPKAAAPAGRQR